MIKFVHPPSTDLPELRPYGIKRHTGELQRSGLFVAEGEKVISRLVQSPLEIVSYLVAESSTARVQRITEGKNGKEIPAYVVEPCYLEAIVGYHIHQGMMALARVPQDADLATLVGQSNSPCLIVAIDRVVNADNVGVLVRNCVALGADALIVGESSASPYYRRAIRSSMGTVFSLPVVHSQNLADDLLSLRTMKRFNVVGADPSGGQLLHQASLHHQVCIVIGNEDEGLSEEIRAQCETAVRIPMKRNTDSLNVANAAALFLYEAMRQRTVKQSA